MGTTVYAYVKREPRRPLKFSKPEIPKKVITGLSLCFVLAGMYMLGSVAWPIVQWQLVYLPKQQEKFASPISRFASPLSGPEVAQAQESTSSGYSSAVMADSTTAVKDPDLYNASSWYPGVSGDNGDNQKFSTRFYTLSIPKVKIDNASVEYNGEDLKNSLIAWKTSSPPGSPGNNIIFGHSNLPQFYDPKSYTNIFTMLPTLEIGDQIFINYDGVSYKYQVFEMQTVDPDDYSVLEQRYDNSYVTLITCVPPGTIWKRLIVRAKIVQYD